MYEIKKENLQLFWSIKLLGKNKQAYKQTKPEHPTAIEIYQSDTPQNICIH